MKNWLPPVSLPACAIDRLPRLCRWGLPSVSQRMAYLGPPEPSPRGPPPAP